MCVSLSDPAEAREHDRRGEQPGRRRPGSAPGTGRARRASHPCDDLLADALRHPDRWERERERRCGLPQVSRLLAAPGARLEVTLDALALGLAQHADRVLGQELANLEAGHGRSLSWFARRTLMSAVRRRVLTVPSGMPSASAISRAVNPPK